MANVAGPNVFPYAGPPPATGQAPQDSGVGTVKQTVLYGVPPFPMEDNQTEEPGEPL